MASADGVPFALSLSPREIVASCALLSDLLRSVAPSGGVEVRGGVATGGVFRAFAAFVTEALAIIALYASSLAPILKDRGHTRAQVYRPYGAQLPVTWGDVDRAVSLNSLFRFVVLIRRYKIWKYRGCAIVVG